MIKTQYKYKLATQVKIQKQPLKTYKKIQELLMILMFWKNIVLL